jgi:hypothetical protein
MHTNAQTPGMGHPHQYRPCQRDQELVPADESMVDGSQGRTSTGQPRGAPPLLGRHTRSRNAPPRGGRSRNGRGTPCDLRRNHALRSEPVGHTPQGETYKSPGRDAAGALPFLSFSQFSLPYLLKL